MRRRARWLGGAALLALLLLLLAWWARTPTAPPLEAPQRAVAKPAPRRPAPASPAPTPTLSADATAPAQPWRLVQEAVVPRLGEYFVDCPIPSTDGLRMRMAGGEVVTYGAGTSFATPWPEGVGITRMLFSDPDPLAFRWSTDAQGVTRCTLEPLERGEARVRVVDADGEPVELRLVLDHSVDAVTTGSDGVATIPVYNGGPRWVGLDALQLGGPPWRMDHRWVRPGDDLTWVVVVHPQGWTLEQQHQLQRLGRWRERDAALREILADPGLDPAARAALEEYYAVVQQVITEREPMWLDDEDQPLPEESLLDGMP